MTTVVDKYLAAIEASLTDSGLLAASVLVSSTLQGLIEGLKVLGVPDPRGQVLGSLIGQMVSAGVPKEHLTQVIDALYEVGAQVVKDAAVGDA